MTDWVQDDYIFVYKHKGYPIYVRSGYGTFHAKLPGRDMLVRSEIKPILAEIDKLGKPVEVMYGNIPDANERSFYRTPSGLKRLTITEMKPSEYYGPDGVRYAKQVRDVDGRWKDLNRFDGTYLYDQSVMDEIDAVYAEEERVLKAFQDERTAEANRLTQEFRDRARAILQRATPLTRDTMKQAKKQAGT